MIDNASGVLALFPAAEVPAAEAQASSDPPRGMAAIAAAAERLHARNEAEYFDLPCRTVLNECSSSRMPFDFTINPYRGCEFGCAYCYARYTHEFLELPTEEAFERRIYVKSAAAEVLARDLARRRTPIGPIAIGSATDPYQPAERRLGLTRSILEVLTRYEGLRISVTTKSDLVVRDLDVLQELARRNSVHVNFSVTTLDAALARTLEPRAPTPQNRLKAVQALSAGGVVAGVFCMPILPFLTDDPAALRRLLFAASEARAHFFAAQVLFLRPCSRPSFFRWLAATRPDLVGTYRALYGRSPYTPFSVADKIKRLVEVLRVPYGLAPSAPDEPPAEPPAEPLPARPRKGAQLPLFGQRPA